MEPPPIQYATSADGYKIAFREAGRGAPLVLMPFPFNNLDRMWRQHTNLSLYEALSERYRLIHYDSRGQGMSERGLSPDHAYADYTLDLEAVIEHLRLDKFVIFAGLLGAPAAIRYASEHPERVLALIFTAFSLENPIGPLINFEELATRSWESALVAFVGANVRIGDKEADAATTNYFSETFNQADFLAMVRASRRATIDDATLASVTCPALIVTGPMHAPPLRDSMKRAAALIPGARLVMLDPERWLSELYTTDGSPPRIVPAIDSFMQDLGLLQGKDDGPVTQGLLSKHGLSPRELEILRLIAQGMSNQQIAEQLVLSVRTVERHISNLYPKIGARRKADATAYALRNGLA